MKRIVIVLALSLQTALSAAPADQAKKKDPTPDEVLRTYDAGHPERVPVFLTALSIGTWNTMLQPWLPYEDRVLKVIQNLSKANLDVIHLQEVWTEGARDRIIAAVGKKYPYRHWVPAAQQAGSCPNSDLVAHASDGGVEEVTANTINDYISCVISTGTDTRTVEQPLHPNNLLCEFLSLNIALESQSCFACIQNTMQNLEPGDPFAFTARDRCFGGVGDALSHHGNVGRLILSRYPIKDVVDVDFATYSIRRVNTYATIKGVAFAFVHWPTNVLQDIDPDLGPFQEGSRQSDLAAEILTRSPRVVVGDFNSGPDYQPDGYNLLKQNNYREVFTNTKTYCPSQLQDFAPCGEFNAVPSSIDNIFLRKDTGACLKTTFANEDQSDHIGLAALCILRTGQ